MAARSRFGAVAKPIARIARLWAMAQSAAPKGHRGFNISRAIAPSYISEKPNPPTPFPSREGGVLYSPPLLGEGLGERSHRGQP